MIAPLDPISYGFIIRLLLDIWPIYPVLLIRTIKILILSSFKNNFEFLFPYVSSFYKEDFPRVLSYYYYTRGSGSTIILRYNLLGALQP